MSPSAHILLGGIMCLVPGLLWLWFFYRKDRYEPEPSGLVIKTFFLGALVIFPVVIVELFFHGIFGIKGEVRGIQNFWAIFIQAFLIAGLVEEYGKYLVVKATVYRSPEFNEVMDGIVYSVSAAVGFATFENFFYFFSHGYSNIIIRSLTASVAHICYSGIMGYYLGLSKFTTDPRRRKKYIRTGLLIAISLHGLYDFLIFTNSLLCLLIIPMLFIVYRMLNARVKLSLNMSPFRAGQIMAVAPGERPEEPPFGEEFVEQPGFPEPGAEIASLCEDSGSLADYQDSVYRDEDEDDI